MKLRSLLVIIMVLLLNVITPALAQTTDCATKAKEVLRESQRLENLVYYLYRDPEKVDFKYRVLGGPFWVGLSVILNESMFL